VAICRVLEDGELTGEWVSQPKGGRGKRGIEMATGKPLGRLQPIKLSEVWVDEARDFTPWLARPENLSLLAETLGIELELEGVEVAVGTFAADIHCKDAVDGSWVVIENQIRRTDHTHLGQVLTYAAGLEARTLVWIAERFTDEHRAALDWLNDHTSEEVSFFGVEIELWRIGSSEPAPKFNLVSKPNDWSKSVRKAAQGGESELSDARRIRLEFWTAFHAWLGEHSDLRGRKASNEPWLGFSLGTSHGHLDAVASTWNTETGRESPELRVDLILDSVQSKTWFAHLEARKSELAPRFQESLHWHNPPDGKRTRIYVRCDEDFQRRDRWLSHFEWFERNLRLMKDLFGPILKGGVPAAPNSESRQE